MSRSANAAAGRGALGVLGRAVLVAAALVACPLEAAAQRINVTYAGSIHGGSGVGGLCQGTPQPRRLRLFAASQPAYRCDSYRRHRLAPNPSILTSLRPPCPAKRTEVYTNVGNGAGGFWFYGSDNEYPWPRTSVSVGACRRSRLLPPPPILLRTTDRCGTHTQGPQGPPALCGSRRQAWGLRARMPWFARATVG